MLQEFDHAHIGGRPLGLAEAVAFPLTNGDGPSDNDARLEQPQARPEIALDELVFLVVAAFRGYPHINNVLTHISGANWGNVEQALRVILDPCAETHELSPLARNIVDLMCADRGVTGRIKPFYRELLITLLGDAVASRLIAHVTYLFLERELAARSMAPGR